MSSVCVGRFVIAVSPDGENNWKLLQPAEVPEWLKNPETLGCMREGFLAHKEDEPDSPFYCALEVPEAPAANGSPIIGAQGKKIILPAGNA